MNSASLFSSSPPLPSLNPPHRIHIHNLPLLKVPHFLNTIQSPNVDCVCSSAKFRTPRRRTIKFSLIKATSESATVVENPSVSAASDGPSHLKSEEDENAAKIGARVRVRVPLKVYHVPKVPEFDLNGKIGVLKQNVSVWKGKRISANLPYKIEFVEKIEGRDGPVKFFAHLKEDEFEFLD